MPFLVAAAEGEDGAGDEGEVGLRLEFDHTWTETRDSRLHFHLTPHLRWCSSPLRARTLDFGLNPRPNTPGSFEKGFWMSVDSAVEIHGHNYY
jgi:hypothetical protein